MLRKLFHCFAVLVFLLFAILQWNDPDPMLWIAAYLLCAVVASYAALQNKFKPVLWVLSLLLSIALSIEGTIALWTLASNHELGQISQSMDPENPAIEQARESIGMLLCITYLFLNSLLTRNSPAH